MIYNSSFLLNILISSLISGSILSGVFLVISGYVVSSVGTVAVMCVSVAFFGFAFSGFMVNAMDVSPKYGSTIIGISNSLASVTGFMGPAMVGVMTKEGVRFFVCYYSFENKDFLFDMMKDIISRGVLTCLHIMKCKHL